jgi:hypothetical protein
VRSHEPPEQCFKFKSFNIEVLMNINRPAPVVKGHLR